MCTVKYFLSYEALLSLVGILYNEYVLLTRVGIWYNKCVKSLLCTECCVMFREELRKNWSLHSKGSESSNRKRTWRDDASTLVPFLSICISKEFGITGSREREQNGEVNEVSGLDMISLLMILFCFEITCDNYL